MRVFGRRKESGEESSLCRPGERPGPALPCKGKLRGWRRRPLCTEGLGTSHCLPCRRVRPALSENE